MAMRYANPGTRVIGSNGALLDSGKLYFYSPGTTTEKTIYSNNALTTERANPVILNKGGLIPAIFLDGSYDVVVKDKNGVQLDDGDYINAQVTQPFDDWSASVTYSIGQIVTASDGYYYASQTNNNVNNDPTSSPSDWELLIDAIGLGGGTNNYLVVVDNTQDQGFNFVSQNSVRGLQLVSAATASNSATVSFTGIDDTYDEYVIVGSRVVPATDGSNLYLRTSTNGGSSYDSGGSDYRAQAIVDGAAGSQASAGQIDIGGGTAVGNVDASETGISFCIHLVKPSDSSYGLVYWQATLADAATNLAYILGNAQRSTAADIDAIQFLFSSGNIASGEIKVYGLIKS